PQFDFIILMASRLTREKNIGLAISAMAEIIKRHPKTGLIIAGDGLERKAIKSQIANWKLQDNIIMESWVDDLTSYYKTADLFLLTSNYEGYGMAVVEAMALGCAVIMTDVGLANEILVDKKEGLVIPVGDKERLTKAILNIIENPDSKINLIQNSQKIMNFWPKKEDYLRAYYASWLFRQKP
ncbi:MAG: glycosyltransferase, partial [bacterium]|nr:glycosyltransferase [bacterium]